MARVRVWLEQCVLWALVVLIWQVYVVKAIVPAFMLPPPLAVWDRLKQTLADGSLLHHTGVTLTEIVVGFLVGTLLGVLFGLVLAWLPTLHQALAPYIQLAQAAPKIALAPLFIIWFGLGFLPKLVLIVSMVFFPVMVGVQLGVNSISRDVRHLSRILRLSPLQRLIHIELPSSLPDMIAGMKVGIVQAVIAAIVAEWMSGKAGLGYLLVYSGATYDTALMLAGIVVTTVLGLLLYKVIEAAESKLLAWHESQQAY